jgi:hypothetical protein
MFSTCMDGTTPPTYHNRNFARCIDKQLRAQKKKKNYFPGPTHN